MITDIFAKDNVKNASVALIRAKNSVLENRPNGNALKALRSAKNSVAKLGKLLDSKSSSKKGSKRGGKKRSHKTRKSHRK
jgi:hypothetical protein